MAAPIFSMSGEEVAKAVLAAKDRSARSRVMDAGVLMLCVRVRVCVCVRVAGACAYFCVYVCVIVCVCVSLSLGRYALMSLGSEFRLEVGADGFLNMEDSDVRKVYLKISQKIHPDKLPHYSDATRAFQMCVRAYELICKPELRANESDDSRDEDEEVGDEDDEVVAAPRKNQKPRKPR